MPQAAPSTWTTRALLAWLADAFTERGLDSPRRLAEMLLAHVIGCDRLKLYTDPDRPATPAERDALRALVRRALAHEPIQYLVGEESFFAMSFKTDPRALIPRPSTGALVERALQHARTNQPSLIADIGTGTGCIALALAKHIDAARVIASDISEDALALAQENADLHDLADRVEFRHGSLADPLEPEAGSIDLIASNPPYIPDHEWPDVEPNVKDHEPHSALRGGADGLDLVRPIIANAPRLLAPDGLLLIEVAACTAQQTAGVAAEAGLDHIEIIKDIDGLDRVIAATNATSPSS